MTSKLKYYAVPEGKFRESETPGFKVTEHRKLKPTDFADPLDYHRWNLWYIREKFKHDEQEAMNEVERVYQLGFVK